MRSSIDDPSVAWDIFTAKQDEQLEALQRENPGCGTCTHGWACPCGCGWVWCHLVEDFEQEFHPSCEYEDYA